MTHLKRGALGACLLFLLASTTLQAGGTIRFTQVVDVFDIPVFATEAVTQDKLLRAAKVLADYIDNDRNGIPDDEKMLIQAIQNGASLIVVKDARELSNIDRLPGFFEYGEEALTLGQIPETGAAEKGKGQAGFDYALEKALLLLVKTGYAHSMPRKFAAEPEMAGDFLQAMEAARGGAFEQVPDHYPEGAWFTNSNQSCDYTCQIHRYFYWSMTSLLGGQSGEGRAEEIKSEWSLNTPALMKQHDPEMTRLLEGFPIKILPDGEYDGMMLTVEDVF